MNPVSIAAHSLLLLGAILCAFAGGGADSEEVVERRIIFRVLGFFGIGGIPSWLAMSVLLSTAAIAGATLDIIAYLHFGDAYPPFFVADAVASGLGVGLLGARLISISDPAPIPHQ